MAIRLRFAMHGITNNRILHLVAIDHRKARNAKPAELLGIYNQRVHGSEEKKSLEWSVDRIRYWLQVGAVPSKPVLKLLEMGGILKPGSPYHPKPRRPQSIAARTPATTPAKTIPAPSSTSKS